MVLWFYPKTYDSQQIKDIQIIRNECICLTLSKYFQKYTINMQFTIMISIVNLELLNRAKLIFFFIVFFLIQ